MQQLWGISDYASLQRQSCTSGGGGWQWNLEHSSGVSHNRFCTTAQSFGIGGVEFRFTVLECMVYPTSRVGEVSVGLRASQAASGK